MNTSCKLQQMEKDAARYRWLRQQNWSDAKFCVVSDPKNAVKLGYSCPSGDLLDNAIDVAMGETS